MNKTIKAVFEVGNIEDNSPWIISKNDSRYIRVYAEISDKEIGSVMLAACNNLIGQTASETLEAFVSDEGFILAGGLLFKENNEVKVVPNCCCGLEDWYQWLTVPNGRVDIWTGHDPESLIEIKDGKIKIWQDRETKDENKLIEFTVDELIEALRNVEKDLKDFLFRLAQWTKYIEPTFEKKVVYHFAKNMHIEI
jgi:hypothetical protein